MHTLIYIFVMSGIAISVLVGVWRYRNWVSCLAALIVLLVSAAVVATQVGNSLETPRFGRFFVCVRLLAYGLFLHLPVTLILCAWFTRRNSRVLAGICVGLAGLVVSTAVYALWIEPYWLEVTHVDLESNKIDRPIRIAIIADLQTDVIGPYEKKTLARVLQHEPDVIVMAGDYLQVDSFEQWNKICQELNHYLKEIEFSAPLGVYAAGGNTDVYSWAKIFSGLPVHQFRTTHSVELDQIQITGLSVADSFNTQLQIGPSEKFHVVFGHAPNFALGDIQADLLIAGHTHGGQVRVPFIGPLVTFSAVPRKWAAGVTDIGGGRRLIVSRGVGMERGAAPRLRFLCRPQVVIVDVRPKAQPGKPIADAY